MSSFAEDEKEATSLVNTYYKSKFNLRFYQFVLWLPFPWDPMLPNNTFEQIKKHE